MAFMDRVTSGVKTILEFLESELKQYLSEEEYQQLHHHFIKQNQLLYPKFIQYLDPNRLQLKKNLPDEEKFRQMVGEFAGGIKSYFRLVRKNILGFSIPPWEKMAGAFAPDLEDVGLIDKLKEPDSVFRAQER